MTLNLFELETEQGRHGTYSRSQRNFQLQPIVTGLLLPPRYMFRFSIMASP